ncbi:hypothetical protein Pla175_09890 [Pirellulimonas nuda]|uniref:Planctomycete cytochrome C n=2 Tax=Pirellulimonas nuda TaxID=2528009 RepID=A0A518D835_9BACT|nr:hypothetical protein Pla175_09890 [Pirellulimonas nuda]
MLLGSACAAADEAPRPEPTFSGDVTPFLTRFCADCHTGAESEAGVDLASVETLAQAQSDPSRWRQVKGLIELGAMPPSDHYDLPTDDERKAMVGAIEWLMERVDCDAMDSPGWVTIRRLNAYEYNNTVRDLLGIDFSPSEVVGFPMDDVGNGFDNQGDVLSLSPLLLEKYLKAAEVVSRRVVSLDPEGLREQRVDGQTLFVGESFGARVRLAPGKYRFRASMRYGADQQHEVPAEVTLDGRPIGTLNAGGKRQTLELDFESTAVDGPADGQIEIKFVDDPAGARRHDYKRRLEVDWLEVVGPAEGAAPLPGPHHRFVIATPKGEKEEDTRNAAEAVFAAFAPLAYRRPATPTEVSRLADIVVRSTLQGASYEEALRVGLQAALVSPYFLFRVEDRPDGSGNNPRLITDYQLASRLSYFLWASTPDAPLYDLARQSTLHLPSRLRGEVRRMLADPRSDALVESFFKQWLGLRNLATIDRDADHFPAWSGRLRTAMLRETQELCREIIREDRSLLELLDADYTYVNPRLAEHYGIEFEGRDPEQMYYDGPGFPANRRKRGGRREGDYVDEDRWVRVPSPPHRRGVLTHASVLALTANPIETSPVKRGKWVLEALLGDPPPPAPPSVPSLEESAAGSHDLPLRDQLAIHRSNPSCASCHVRMDPIGLAMENYDAVGRWRDDFHGHPIDPAGALDGERFSGPLEMAAVLRGREQEIVRNAVERMLTYALGRGLRLEDQCYVEEIVAAAAKDNYRFSSLVAAIVVSEPFRMSGHTKPKPAGSAPAVRPQRTAMLPPPTPAADLGAALGLLSLRHER